MQNETQSEDNLPVILLILLTKQNHPTAKANIRIFTIFHNNYHVSF